MSNVKLEPGWLERDVVQAVRRTHELDEQKKHARKTGEPDRTDNTGSRSDSTENK